MKIKKNSRTGPSTAPAEARPNIEPLRRQEAADLIRELILAGESGFRSGDILSENQLVARLNLTRTPIRQALSKLASEGLVSILPRVGTQVRVVRPEEARAIIGMRYAIETIIIGELIQGRPNLQPLQEIHDKMIAAARNSGSGRVDDLNVEFVKLDMQFHVRMAELVDGYTAAATTLKELTSQFLLYALRSLQVSHSKEVIEEVLREHSEILKALSSSKTVEREAAREALHHHLKEAVKRMAPFAVSYIEERVPEFFASRGMTAKHQKN